MSHQFLKKKFSFTRLFLRFFGILIFSLSITVNVYAASDSVTAGVNSLSDFYKHVTTLPKNNSVKITKKQPESKNISAQTNVFTQATAIAGQANLVAASVSDVVSSWFSNYYDSYTSGLSSILYPVKNISLTKVTPATSKTTQGTATATSQIEPKALSVKTTPLNSTSPRPSPYQGEGGKQIVYVPIPGPQGPKGDKGEPGTSITNFQSSSINPVAYMPVGITIPNPSQNFTGGEYASIANLTSNLFTNNTSNIITLNVSGNQTVTGNSSVGGTFNVTGATTLSGNLNVTGTITGSVTGAMNPALTNGSVFFQDTAGISQDNANFFYDKVNHRLGLGTVAPASVLHVSGAGAGLIRIQNTNTNGRAWGIETVDTGAGANGTFEIVDRTLNARRALFLANGAVSMGPSIGNDVGGSDFNIDSTGNVAIGALSPGSAKLYVAGNVGIGTTAPAQLLQINSSQPDLVISQTNTANYGRVVFRENSTEKGGMTWIGTTFSDAVRQNSLEISGNSGFIGFRTNNGGDAERVRITNTGNVGIGTTAPNYALTLAGVTDPSIALTSINNTNPQGLIRWQLSGQALKWYVGTHQYLSNDFEIGDAGAARLVVQATSGNVGIGTTGPGYKLDVNGTFGVTGASTLTGAVTVPNTLLVYTTGGNQITIDAYASTQTGDLVFKQGGNFGARIRELASNGGLAFHVGADAEKVRIDSTGNVGIGTTAPGYPLQVHGTTLIESGNTTGLLVFGAGNQTSLTSGTDFFRIQNYSSGLAGYQDVFYAKQGNVGIGTTAPGEKLDVSGNIRLSGQIGLGVIGVSGLQLINNGTVGTADSQPLMFRTVSVERMRIDTAGNVGIGTTAPGNKLSVSISDGATSLFTNATQVGLNLLNTSATTNNYNLISFEDLAGNGAVEIGAQFTDHTNHYGDFVVATRSAGGATEKMRVTSTGNVGIGTTGPETLLHVNKGSTGTTAIIGNTSGRIYLESFSGENRITSVNAAASASQDMNFNGVSGANFVTIKSTGNVGIGTTSPNNTLNVASGRIVIGGTDIGNTTAGMVVSGATNSSNYGYQAGQDSTHNLTMGWRAATVAANGYSFIESYGGSNPLGLQTSGGNVGIGTTAPGRPLDVVGAQVSDGSLRAVLGIQSTSNYNGNPAPGIDFLVRYTSAGALAGIAGISGYKVNLTDGDYSGGLQFHTRNNGSSQAEVMRIDNLGNVGIGTTGPTEKLDVNGSIRSRGYISLDSDYEFLGNVYYSSGYKYRATAPAQDMYYKSNGDILFKTAVSGAADSAVSLQTRLTLSNAGGLSLGDTTYQAVDPGAGKMIIQGNVGIGTTGPLRPLDVNGSIRTNGVLEFGTVAIQSYITGAGAGNANDYLAFGVSSSEAMRIKSGGNVGIGTTSPVSALQVNGVVNATGYTIPGQPASILSSGTSGLRVAGGYLWADGSGTSLYVTNTAVFRGSITDDTHTYLTIGGGTSGYTYMSGNVGIGTTAPGVGGNAPILDIVGTQRITAGGNSLLLSGSDPYIKIHGTGTGVPDYQMGVLAGASPSVFVGSITNHPLAFYVNNAEKVRIDTAGNVGIGTTNPTNLLQVNGGNFYVQTGAMILDAGRKITFDSGGTTRASIRSSASNAKDLTFETNGTDQMVIKSDGNVGIGTTGPARKLEVSGAVPQMRLTYSVDPTYYTDYANNGIDFYGTGQVFAFKVAGTEKVRIDTNGNVGIGTTSPQRPLDVNGSIRTNGVVEFGTVAIQSYITGAGVGNANDYLAFGVSSSEAMRIKNTGNVGIGTTAPGDSLNIARTSSGGLTLDEYSTDTARGTLNFRKARGTAASPSTTAVNDYLGLLDFTGYGSSAYSVGAELSSQVEAVGANNYSNFLFSTRDQTSGLVTERVRIANSGNVGIGTTSPVNKLDINGGAAIGTYAGSITSPANSLIVSGKIGIGVGNPGQALVLAGGNQIQISNSQGLTGLQFVGADGSANTIGTMGSGEDLVLRTNSSERIRILSTGNVGIGTTAPVNKLQITNTSAGALTTQLSLQNASNVDGTGASLDFSAVGGDGSTATSRISSFRDGSGDYSIRFSSYGASALQELMRIKSNGNVGIGTTSPAQKLEVSGTIRQTGCTTAGTLSANVSGDIICTPSSQKFKNNITSLDTGLSAILALRPVSYTFKPDMNLGDGIHFGFISEEVANVNAQFATHDAEGNPYGLDNNAILSATVNAIKELDLKIQPLTSLNIEQNGSLASLIRDYLENAVNGLRKIFVGEVNTKSLCVSDDTGAKTCITKSQLDALISGASGSVVNNSGGNTLPPEPTPDPVCTSPQTLVNGVCVDPIPETPPSDTPPAETP